MRVLLPRKERRDIKRRIEKVMRQCDPTRPLIMQPTGQVHRACGQPVVGGNGLLACDHCRRVVSMGEVRRAP